MFRMKKALPNKRTRIQKSNSEKQFVVKIKIKTLYSLLKYLQVFIENHSDVW